MRPLDTKEIVIATHNDGKLREFNTLIAPFGFMARSAGEMNLPEPKETGTTFEENAAIKALAAAKASNMPALSDDSGICVDALDGQPGVYTADWAEQPDGTRDFGKAMAMVEEQLQEKDARDAAQRGAKFVSVLCLAWPDGHIEYFRGEVTGTLVWPPRGEQGFGYDPVFRPKSYERTFGEMSAEEKYGWVPGGASPPLSHRARAFALFARMKLETG